MTCPLVLLVEDDPSIARFVSAALEELPIDLLARQSVQEAWHTVLERPVALIISDLMLPGGSGADLLRSLRASPQAAHRAMPVIVLSAGLNAGVLRELQALGVFRALSKPVSVRALESCVSEALGLDGPPQRAGWRGELPGRAPQVSPAEDVLHMAVATYFGGDRALFDAYKASCLAQFVNDAEQGDAAVCRGDAQGLRRVAHSLKSLLLTLGDAEASELARATEGAAAAGDAVAAAALWGRLRERLLQAA